MGNLKQEKRALIRQLTLPLFSVPSGNTLGTTFTPDTYG